MYRAHLDERSNVESLFFLSHHHITSGLAHRYRSCLGALKRTPTVHPARCRAPILNFLAMLQYCRGEEHMQNQDYLDTLYRVLDGLNERFPNGNTPFQIISRLCEESGELAKAVNHFEGTGIKMQKYGEPDRAELAKEVQDVLRAALSIARYYGIEQELRASIDESYRKLKTEGFIKEVL
jgi:NTP pyrophosphatase (non-canonical NTP hydrolase)